MVTETARKYGGSLYELALEDQKTDEVLGQLKDILGIFKENPDYLRILSEPSIPKAERCKLLDDAFKGNVWPYLLNFLKLLCEKGYIREFKGCVGEFRKRFNDDHGIAQATVTTARELTVSQKDSLRKKLEALSGKKVDMIVYTNPALLGGIRVDMEGKRYDGTAKERLDQLQHIIENTVV
ncbi:ATP synthase F1 subunit delta [Butyrivibrio sp. NC3005]|jgi:F-type H+-transporting ATPase subunit delta|uniref:ATP synthase F1 subunit delta n=1 Tax=Butyrivibrio sp. NC3005 TaxID=1280685 RepID=UPI0004286413|nr:ATP synthase F1 subunit delta [Butyrivibrio sp. NC3005]